MHRSTARAIVQAIKAPVPTTGGGTLYVEGVPAVGWDTREQIRESVARYALRVALDKGLARIVVRHPRRGDVAFDVVDLILATVADIGCWPIVPRYPVGLATANKLAVGAEIARTRPSVFLPAALTPVSGFESGRKE